MATLTTIDGIQITFTVKAISAISDHDVSTGEIVTCVYGITRGYLRIAETVPAFMARLKIGSQFAKFTRPNNSPVWINASAVASIRAPMADEYIPGVSTVIFADSLTQGVEEPPKEVAKALNAHGGEF